MMKTLWSFVRKDLMRKTPPHSEPVFDSNMKQAKLKDESTSAKNDRTPHDDVGLRSHLRK